MIVLSLVDRFAWKVQAPNWSFYLHIGHFSMWKSCWVATSLDTLWRYQSPTVWTQHRLLRRDATRTRIRKQEKNRCSWYFVCLLAHFFKTSKHLLIWKYNIYIYMYVWSIVETYEFQPITTPWSSQVERLPPDLRLATSITPFRSHRIQSHCNVEKTASLSV